jgi:hypothetical protein
MCGKSAVCPDGYPVQRRLRVELVIDEGVSQVGEALEQGTQGFLWESIAVCFFVHLANFVDEIA